MTEEEIRPIAEQYVEEYCHCSDGEYTDGSLICAGIGTALIVARRLEKKNAELKRRLDNIFNSDCWASEKLTKAKEIIKELLKALDGRNGFDEDVFGRAEQFLKEK